MAALHWGMLNRGMNKKTGGITHKEAEGDNERAGAERYLRVAGTQLFKVQLKSHLARTMSVSVFN